jgi:uncharacterized membrane protein
MNLRLYTLCIVAVLMLVGPAAADISATIHGVVYGWDTFDPLDNAIVEVNSTPSQSMVAKYGLYSFELAPGDYTITASYYQNSTLTYQAKETITVEEEGNYVLDLLLLPVYSSELMDNSDETPTPQETLTESSNKTTNETEKPGGSTSEYEISLSTTFYLLGALLISLLLMGGYKFSQKQKDKKESSILSKTEASKKEISKTEAYKAEKVQGLESFPSEKIPEPLAKVSPRTGSMPETKVVGAEKEAGTAEGGLETRIAGTEPDTRIMGIVSEKKVQENLPSKTPYSELSVPSVVESPALKKTLPLPSDLQEIMDIIRGQGGRITQKELRSRLKYSEGKVSLMLADLERRELIEKFKRGRGNVVILRDDKR